MKTHGLILLSALLVAALMLHGQEAAPPSVDLFPEQEEEASPTPPPNGPELPELKQLDDSFKPKSLGTDADALQVHALWRQLKNRTVNDPEVQAAKKYAQAARTDLEKRKRLRAYYEVYYKRMSALATTPELKVALQAQKDVHQGMLAQPRVRPSPTPESSVRRHRRPQARLSRKRPKRNTRRRRCTSSIRFSGSGWRRLGCGFAHVQRGNARLPDSNIAKCRAMLDLAKILLAAPTAVF